MVLLPEHHLIMAFCLIVRRIAIEKGTLPVVLPDQRLKVFILYHCICQPVGCLPDGVKAFPHIKRLAAVRSAATSVAIADQLEKSRRPFYICYLRIFQKDCLYLLEIRRRQVMPGQLHLFFQIRPVKLLLIEKVTDHREFIPAVDPQKPQLPQKIHRTVLHTVKQVSQIGIESL